MTGSVDVEPSRVRYSFIEIGKSPVWSVPSAPNTNESPCRLKVRRALKTSFSLKKKRLPGSHQRTRNAKINCRRMPQATTLHGKFLRSSDNTQATATKMKIP